MKRDLGFYIRMTHICKIPIKVQIHIFLGTLISLFVVMCVFTYSVFLDTELKREIDTIDGSPYLYFEIKPKYDLTKVYDYCKSNSDVVGTAISYCGSVSDYYFAKGLLWRDVPEYTNSYISIGGKEYKSVYKADEFYRRYPDFISPYIAATYYDIDNQCMECFSGKLICGAYPDKLNEIMVSRQYLETYGIGADALESIVGKNFSLNSKYLKDKVISGIIDEKSRTYFEGIYIPVKDKKILYQGEYNIYLKQYEVNAAEKIQYEIANLFHTDCYKSRSLDNYEYLVKQQKFIYKIIIFAAALITLAAFLKIYADVYFLVTTKKRSIALMMSIGMSLNEMHLIYLLNYLKLLFVASISAVIASYMTILRLSSIVFSDLGKHSVIDTDLVVSTFSVAVTAVCTISMLIMAIVFRRIIKSSSEADCLKV